MTIASAERVIYYTQAPSPIGPLLLTSDGHALTGLYMSAPEPVVDADHSLRAWGIAGPPDTWVPDDAAPPFAEARAQLAAYFAGRLTAFTLPLAPAGTPFQQRVWTALQAIPYGATISYGALAQRIGSPNGSRAVGLANGRNPIALIVPCHRVIGANGTLTGYGGGLPRKAALLAFEAAVRRGGAGPFPPVGADAVPAGLASQTAMPLCTERRS